MPAGGGPSTNGSVAKLPRSPEAQPRWVTALFVQFRFFDTVDSQEREKVLDYYRAILEHAVGIHGGDVVALAIDAALAVFSGEGHPQEHTRSAMGAAALLMDRVAQANRQRLALNLIPLRLGIGVDAGMLTSSSCNRHPCLDPGLQQYLNKARGLSELNYQAPFPAVFVSHTVAGRLDYGEHYAVQNLGDVFVENLPDPLAVFAVMNHESR